MAETDLPGDTVLLSSAMVEEWRKQRDDLQAELNAKSARLKWLNSRLWAAEIIVANEAARAEAQSRGYDLHPKIASQEDVKR